MKKQMVDSKILTAQEFINVEDISDDVIYSKDGYLFGFLKVKAADASLLNEDEKIRKTERVAAALMTGDGEPFTILSIPRTVNTVGMIEYLTEQRNHTRQDAKLKLINGEIAALQNMTRQGTKEPMIVIKRWVKAAPGADIRLKNWLSTVQGNLEESAVSAELLKTKEIIYLCKVFADLTEYQSSEEEIFEDIPLLSGQKRILTKRSRDEEGDMLRNLITPVGGLSFGVSKTIIGNVVGSVYGAMRYPSEINYGWAVKIMNASDCITAITYYPGETNEMAEALGKSMQRNLVEADTEKDIRRRKHFERKVADADALLDQLDFKQGCIGHITILTMPFSKEEEKLEEVCRQVRNRFGAQKIKLKVIGNLQKEAFKSLTPYYVPQPVIEGITKQLIPLETLTGGFPITVNIFRDDRGMYFARTTDGSIISLDLLYRGHDRANSNMIFTGESGQGKSTSIKHILQCLYMQGVRCIIIDPEREFRDLCKNLGGAWLDIGGGTTKINPLQVRPGPQDDENDEEYKAQENALALHIRNLDTFFSFYIPTLTDPQKALLKRHIIAVYQKFGITWDTDVRLLSAEKFPIIADVQKSLAAENDADCKALSLMLEDMAAGADSFLWNGHTNISLDADIIVLDTYRLTNSSKNVKQAQYYNALMLCWEYMIQNPTEPVLLVSDETHTILDPECPQAAAYLKNFAKRCRKYEGMLITVLQSISDALNDRIKEYGQALLDNATYKILFGCDGKNLEDTVNIMKLTKEEKDTLLKKEKKTALAIIGSQHIKVRFELPQYKLDLMGKGGGR